MLFVLFDCANFKTHLPCFSRYLFKQLLTYNGNRSHPIFTRSDTGKLKLRDKIQVHLYISRPPCGDAAAFPTISNFPNKMRAIRKQGQLRTIIDDGQLWICQALWNEVW